MKVLLISHTCQSLTEGQPKAVELAARLDGELLVLTPDRWRHYGKWRRPQPPSSAGYHYAVGKVALPWTGPGQFYLHYYPELPSLLKKFQPDIIDVWEEPWGLVSAQVCWLRQKILPKARVISETEQNLDRRYPPPFSWFRSYTLSQADFAIARSEEALRVIRSQGYNGPAEVVPNAVDAELFRPLDRPSCRKALCLDGIVIGYVGRLVERKGLMDLMDALPLCPPGTRLLFAGSGELLPALQQRAAQLGLEEYVRFIPECPLEALPQFMNSIDLLALPSRTTPTWKEQFGRVIIEAHSCGTPVIGSTSGAIRDVIGRGGACFPERNPAALAACVVDLTRDPARLHEAGVAGRRQVLERYTWSKVAEQMLKIYDTVQHMT